MSMSVPALFSSMTTLSTPLSIQTRTSYNPVSAPKVVSGMGGVVIECSSRPHKKATAHHMKTRPKKTAGWELRRRPTVYAPLPSLPPDFTVVGSAASESVPNDVSPATPPD